MSLQNDHLPLKQESTSEMKSNGRTNEESTTKEETLGAEVYVRPLKPFSWLLVVCSLLAALFLFALDNTIVADVQVNIIYTLGGIEKLPWISVAFALGAVATNLFWYTTRYHLLPVYHL